MGRWARMGVVCLMGLAISLARLVEVELDPVAPPALSVTTAAAEPVIEESPSRPGRPIIIVPRAASTDPADPAAPAPATEPSAGARTHVVKSGESLGTISTKEYGSAKHWKRILDANPGLDPARLQLGQRLAIPANPDAPRH
jgi:nucleoid-associated protein YgaU